MTIDQNILKVVSHKLLICWVSNLISFDSKFFLFLFDNSLFGQMDILQFLGIYITPKVYLLLGSIFIPLWSEDIKDMTCLWFTTVCFVI